MLVLVELNFASIEHLPSARSLAAIAAEHEVVVVASHATIADGLVAKLRAVLPNRQIVALLVCEEIEPHEREFVEEILNDGRLPVLLTTTDPASPGLTSWLRADRRMALPADVPC